MNEKFNQGLYIMISMSYLTNHQETQLHPIIIVTVHNRIWGPSMKT